MSTERQAVWTHGPLFFRDKGEIMFQFTIDAGNTIGPRKASKADIDKYPEAYAKMADEEEVNQDVPFEEDGEKDKKGGFRSGFVKSQLHGGKKK